MYIWQLLYTLVIWRCLLTEDFGGFWVFFKLFYIKEHAGLLSAVCIPAALGEQTSKTQSFLHYSLEKTQLRALGLSFLYIGLVPFSNLKKPAFVKLKKRSALVSRAGLSCPPPPTWSLPCSGPGLTLCSPSVQAFMQERSLQCKSLWKAEIFLLLGSALCCWV